MHGGALTKGAGRASCPKVTQRVRGGAGLSAPGSDPLFPLELIPVLAKWTQKSSLLFTDALEECILFFIFLGAVLGVTM